MIYGNVFKPEDIQEATAEQEVEYYRGLLEALAELEELEESMQVPEVVEEGANKDYKDELKKYRTELKEITAEAKKAKKAKDKDEYIKQLNRAKELSKKAKKAINDIQPTKNETIASVVIGIIKAFIFFELGVAVSTGILMMGSKAIGYGLAAATGAATGSAVSGENPAKDTISFKKFDKNASEEDKAKAWNMYRGNCIKYINYIIGYCDSQIKYVKAKW